MRITLGIALAALALAVPGVALAGGGGGGPCPAYASGPLMSMEDNCFAGIAHFVEEGQPLEVRNNGRIDHTFTSVDGLFDSGSLSYGETFEISGLEAGVYKIVCTLHGSADGHGMAGVLIVGDPGTPLAAAAAPPAAAPPAAAAPAPPAAESRDLLPITLAALALVVATAALISPRLRRRPEASAA